MIKELFTNMTKKAEARSYGVKSQYKEIVLSKKYDMVMHAIIPYDIEPRQSRITG